MTPHESYFPGLHGQLAAKIWGPMDGLPVLALHGWLDNAATFDTLAPLLPELRIAALDLPGHGLADHRPPGLAYWFLDYPLDALMVADALGWEQFHVMGHSLGGAVGVCLAASFPDRVKSLILLESMGPLSSQSAELPKQFRSHWDARVALAKKKMPSYESVEAAARHRQSAGDIALESAILLAERGTKRAGRGVTWSTDPRLRLPSPLRLDDSQTEAFLRAIACPTLVVRAQSGLPLSDEERNRRLACLREVVWEAVPGHHHVHLDAPHLVAPLVADFYAQKAHLKAM